ncbi:glycosyltransferase [Clostridium chrysemydis]|uniref:glycosyltransferase n=1 Tax=Clostridium chrysemydis TaxID=2665504 RepID=UPI001883CC96|nr:glycosyltransferase [Clostridium chrysemydis]
MKYILSVIIPVYNIENYLEKCIDSVLKQRFKNYEIILVNDGSTDNSLKICKRYKQRYNNITLIDKKNGGLSDARNAGLKIANGEFVVFIDSDDYIDEFMFEKMINVAQKDNLDLVICDCERVYESKEIDKICKCDLDSSKLYNNEELLYNYLLQNIRPNAWDKLYRKSLFIENNIEFPKGLYHEDLLTTFRIIKEVKRAKYIDEPFYKYLCREGSITTNLKLKNLEDMSIIIKRINELFNEMNLQKEYVDAFNILNYNVCSYIKNNINDEKKENIIADIKSKFIKNKMVLNKLISNKERIKFILNILGISKVM